MNRYAFILWLLLPICAHPQGLPSSETEQQLEQIAEGAEDAEVTDDGWLQQMEYLRNNRLNLNNATEADLTELQMLSAIQVSHFINYRKILGTLISIYELQAVPGWDLSLIQKLLPYITVAEPAFTKESLLKRLRKGDHRLMLRYSRVIEQSKGYREKDSTHSFYAGDPTKLALRYQYRYKDLLQYGLTLSKDAGEPLLNKTKGVDFHSFHLFAGKMGMVRAVVLGDYSINMGQGLIHWQGLSFSNGSAITNIKRQSVVLRPYNSTGTFYFHRGVAVTLEKNSWQGTAFLSMRKLDAKTDKDPVSGEDFISSIHTSGYHRTQSERTDQGALNQLAYGANLRYKYNNWHTGVNMIQYQFSSPIQKAAVPYNVYALTGKRHLNYSIDYSLTLKNMHLFGEAAIDKELNTAYINGILLSAHPKASVSLLHRSISTSYQAFFGNALTVNNAASNEQGLFAGLSLKPLPQGSIDLYTDIFRFPWLKYRTDAPSYGKDYSVQVSYRPSKQTEIFSRYRSRQKAINQKTETNAMNEVIPFFSRSWRTQVSHKINTIFSVRQRFELLWYDPEKGIREKGFLAFFDVFCNPPRSGLGINIRLQFFESDSYNSRLYAYENDVLYYYAIPVFYDKGSRYYINAKYKLNKHATLWIKWGQIIYSGKDVIGSGLDEIKGNKKSEIRMLLSVTF